MSAADWATVVFGTAGAFFFLGGTLGLLRFPDLFSRLHALTKADNLGLGLIVVGLLFQADSIAVGLKLLLIWSLALLASSSACYAIGRHALERSQAPTGKEAEDGRG
ncbi:MAG: monovalent cation/H(+) antiporter subunit G [Opitutales bacterium]|nr:monovalent cation/H(+) antiporter subunit G [Opitutales bacterium]